jgi:hypothetical protein
MKITLEDINNNFGYRVMKSSAVFIMKHNKEIAKVLLPYLLENINSNKECISPNMFCCDYACKNFIRNKHCPLHRGIDSYSSLIEAIKSLQLYPQLEFCF